MKGIEYTHELAPTALYKAIVDIQCTIEHQHRSSDCSKNEFAQTPHWR